MLKNLKNLIVLILAIIVLLLVVFTSLAAVKPTSQIGVKSISEEKRLSGKWSGLGISVYSTKDNVTPWELSATFDDDIDTLLANGFTDIRIDIPTENANALAISKSTVAIAVAKGANVIWGICGYPPLTAANWAAHRQAILDVAQWAQDNGVYEFIIGNEEESKNDNTTLTDDQLRLNLKSVATDVQAIFTNGNVVYSTYTRTNLAAWDTLGLGDIDLLGYNSYMEENTQIEWDWWKEDMDLLIGYFGVDKVYYTEFGPSYISLDDFSTDEAVQEATTADMIDYIKASGIKRALYFNYYDDSLPYGPEGFGALKTDGTYRKLWNVLTGTGTSTPDITITPASKAFVSTDIDSSANPEQVFTITNTGSASLAVGTITITGTDASQFAKSGDTASGQSIAAGASKTVTVTFDLL